METDSAGLGHGFLRQQGYDYTSDQLRQLTWGLRFTPFVCMALAVYGVMTRQPAVHFTLAVLGIGFFWLPAWHPFDLLYNHALRPLWKGAKLPPNPLPRRISCVIGGAMNLGIALAFVAGNVPLAYVFAAILIPLQIVVITTHFCVASWMYEGLLRALGLWTPPISATRAREILAADGLLVDVRTPAEFAAGHLPDALNIPLDTIDRHATELGQRPVVLYCRSGMRSHRAMKVLQKRGHQNAHNLGAMSRW